MTRVIMLADILAASACTANAREGSGDSEAGRVLGARGVGRCSENADEYDGTHHFSFASAERLSWINV